jgi:hypothetical protein
MNEHDDPAKKKVVGTTPSPAIDQINANLADTLFSSSLDFVRSAYQTLQAMTLALLAVQVGLVAAFPQTVEKSHLVLLSVTPIVIFVLSLVSGFLITVFRPGFSFTVGDMGSTFRAYESLVKVRRNDVVFPAILTFVGIVFMVIFAFQLSEANRLAKTAGAKTVVEQAK